MSNTPIVAVDVPLYVSRHAIERAQQRHPSFVGAKGVGGMYAEVSAALREGRKAKTMPRWALLDDRGRRSKVSRRHGTGLFVWNRQETRCYTLRRGVGRHGRGWIVVTMVGREDVT